MSSTKVDVGLALYRGLLEVRFAEDWIRKHYREDEMKTPMHMSRGQEAVAVGVLHAVGERARVFCSYRSHAAYLARTHDLAGFFAELHGRATGPNRGKAGSMHIAAPRKGHVMSSGIVAAQIAPAVGWAWAAQRLGRDDVAVCFFGDGAMNEGAFWESLNLAALVRAPVMFVLEDNGYAVHTPSGAREVLPRTGLLMDSEIPAYTVDGMDVEAVHYCAAGLLKWCDSGAGVGFLGAQCYRYLEHVGVDRDDEAGYRDADELDGWRARDPITAQRLQLLERGVEPARLDLERVAMKDRVREAARMALATPFAPAREAHEGVTA